MRANPVIPSSIPTSSRRVTSLTRIVGLEPCEVCEERLRVLAAVGLVLHKSFAGRLDISDVLITLIRHLTIQGPILHRPHSSTP
jgi:hypothetical protein